MRGGIGVFKVVNWIEKRWSGNKGLWNDSGGRLSVRGWGYVSCGWSTSDTHNTYKLKAWEYLYRIFIFNLQLIEIEKIKRIAVNLGLNQFYKHAVKIGLGKFGINCEVLYLNCWYWRTLIRCLSMLVTIGWHTRDPN